MKTYLVAYKEGSLISSGIVRMAADYIPSFDDMRALKEAVVEQYHPESYSTYANSSSCGGYLGTTSHGKIEAKKLKILAVSNLDI